jgi:hypothetical protein
METQLEEVQEDRRRQFTSSISSKLRKFSLAKKIPRILKQIVLRISSFIVKALRSREVRQIRSQAISLSISAYFWIGKSLNRAWSIALPLAKTSASKVMSFRPSMIRIPFLTKPSQTTQLASFPALPGPNATLPVNYPVSGPARFPRELERSLREFSQLPMWFTLPIIFGVSFAIGVVVSILV